MRHGIETLVCGRVCPILDCLVVVELNNHQGMCHIFILYLGVYSLGYDGSLLNGLQALTSWQRDFGAPAGTKLGLIAASYYMCACSSR